MLTYFILLKTRKLEEVTEDWYGFPGNESCTRTLSSVFMRSLEHRSAVALDMTVSTKHVIRMFMTSFGNIGILGE